MNIAKMLSLSNHSNYAAIKVDKVMNISHVQYKTFEGQNVHGFHVTQAKAD